MGDRKAIIVEILGESKKLKAELDEALHHVTSFKQKLSIGAGIAGGALLGIGADVLKEGLKGLADQDTAQKTLQDALSRTSGAFADQQEAMQKNAEELQKSTRFSYEDVLAADTQISKSKALVDVVNTHKISLDQLNQTTLDFATVSGTDAATAADTLSKALANPFNATKKLTSAHVELSLAEQKQIAAWKKTGDAADAQKLILSEVEKQTKGAADEAGNTLPGKLDRAKHAFEEVEKKLASALLPILTKVMDWFLKITAWAEANPGKMKVVAAVIGGLAGALLAVSVATKIWAAGQAVVEGVTAAWTVAQNLLNITLLGCPLLLIIAGVIGLTVGIVELWKHCETFRTIVKDAFAVALAVVTGVWDWIKGHWPLLLAILTGPIGIAVLEIHKHWDAIKSGAKTLIDGVKTVFSKVTDYVLAPFKLAFNGIADAWNNTVGRLSFHIPGWVPGIGGDGFSVPQIPHFANGVNNFRGGMALVGERGPELVNLPGGSSVIPNHALGGGGGQVTVVVDFSGVSTDALISALRQGVRARGGNVQTVLGQGF